MLEDFDIVTMYTRGRNEENGDITQMTVFKDSKQGRARQGKADADRNTGE